MRDLITLTRNDYNMKLKLYKKDFIKIAYGDFLFYKQKTSVEISN